MNLKFNHLKKQCAGCEQTNLEMSREHVFPQWLILKTNTHRTGIRWLGGGKIPANRATIPLCKECNELFGSELEGPISNIFNDLETHQGISDYEAELLVRWLWKIKGLFWIIGHPDGKYSQLYTLKERVLKPIDKIRDNLVLCVSLIKELETSFPDKPMGLDSETEHDAIFVSGVFSRVAIMVILQEFRSMVPDNFSQYTLHKERTEMSSAKLFHPKIGFENGVEAVGKTLFASKYLTKAHDDLALKRITYFNYGKW